MSPNRRIVFNIIASYGRTLIGVACGIFSTRWVLMALGNEDFGLFGIVGSLAIFMSFLNIQFSSALSRFYAFAIGKAYIASNNEVALEECREWFTTGLVIHAVLPILLVGIGYPIGAMAIANGWLIIPADRVDVCIWLWRFVSLSCFISMINVPFQSMYTAKQYIAELTIYSIAQVVFRTSFIYYMTTVSRDWLFDYGLMVCIVSIVPQLIICLRAWFLFPECRIRVRAINCLCRIKELSAYAWWQMFAGIGYLARHQCLEIVVNKFFGPRVNAAYTVGATVGGEAAALTGALNGAFGPAVTTAYGSGDVHRMRTMAYFACKFGTLLTLIFAIPLCLEAREVLVLWLKNPPECAEGLCLCWLVVVVVEKFSLGHGQAINACGQVSQFYFFRGVVCLMAIPFSICFVAIFKCVYAVGWALILTTALVCCSDVWLAQKRTGLSMRYWIERILVPIVLITVLSCGVGLIPRCCIKPSLFRVFVTSTVTFAALSSLSWCFALDSAEKSFVMQRILAFLRRPMQNS